MVNLSKKFNFGEIILWVIVFFTPLIFYIGGFDMYEVPKNIFFKTGVSLILIWYAINVLRGKTLKIFTNQLLNYSVGAFLVILLLSWLFSIRPSVSFWGSYFRQGGIINYLHYIALFIIGLQIFSKKLNRFFFLKLISFTGFLVSIYAIFQRFGIDIFSSEITAIFDGRSFSSLGNPTVLGAFLIFPFWSEISLLFAENKSKKNLARHFIFIAIILAAIFFTANRATLLALLIASVLVAFYHFRYYKKLIITGATIAVILLAVFVNYYGKDLRSLNSRISIWQSSIEIVKENPIIGYGAESFPLLFEAHVRDDFFDYEDYYKLVDRPHNEGLEMWIHFGLMGLLFYLFIIIACLKKFFQKEDEIKHYMSAAIITLFISNFFSFSLTIHYVFLALVLALVFSQTKEKIPLKPKGFIKTGAVVVIIIILINISANVALFYSNHQLKSASEAIALNDFQGSIFATQKTLQFTPQYYEIYSLAFNNLYVIALSTHSESALSAAAEANSQFKIKSRSSLKSMLNETKVLMITQQYDYAEEVFKEIFLLKGDHPLIYEYWGNMYFKQGNFKKAAIIYDELLNLLPKDWQAPLLSGGELTKKQRIFWKTHSNFIETLKNMITTYQAIGETKKAETILKALK